MVESVVQEVKNECIRKLSEAGATPELTKFYADAIQYEYEMTHIIYRLHNEVRAEVAKADALPAEILYRIVKTMTKYFHTWKLKVDSLAKECNVVPPLQVSPKKPQTFKAVCSLETNELNLQEGEEVVITDSSHPNWLKVRNPRGEEGFVPAMPCILPTPDNSALTAVERLEILLLTSWTECMRKMKTLLTSTLTSSSKAMTVQWNAYIVKHFTVTSGEDKVGVRLRRILDFVTNRPESMDFTKVHRTLGHIESQLMAINSSNGLSAMTATVANLDRAVLCFQQFYSQWRLFRKALQDAPRPIRMVEQWDQLRRASQCRNFKYYEMKMTLEELETLEEITYINTLTGELMSTSGKFRRESCEADDLTSITQEERKRYVIRAVVDPRTNREISFRQAVKDGVVDYRSGMHKNPVSGAGVSIPEAMRIGLIDVSYTSVSLSPPKINVVPLITVRRRVDRNFTLTGALDALTAERVDLTEAYQRKLLDSERGYYHNELTGQAIPLEQALDDGWVFADYDETNPEFDTVTYAVIAVVDSREQRAVSFLQAIRRGLIDRETGYYVNNKTGKRVYVPDAIEQGLVKARRIPKDVNILNVPIDSNLLVPDTNRSGLSLIEENDKSKEGSSGNGNGNRVAGDSGRNRDRIGGGGVQFGFGLVGHNAGPQQK